MVITCATPNVVLNNNVYINRHINLSNIVVFDKSTSHTFDSKYPSIKFTSVTRRGDSAQIYEWVFENEEDRDVCLRNILTITNAEEC